jgi:hypothetical protein
MFTLVMLYCVHVYNSCEERALQREQWEKEAAIRAKQAQGKRSYT